MMHGIFTPLGIIRPCRCCCSTTTVNGLLLTLARQWSTNTLTCAIIFWTFYEEGGDAFPERVGEPDDLGFFKAGGGWWLEEEGGDGVAHGLE